MSQGFSAAILAGGLGTRLRDAVPDRQKVTADVSGRPFIRYLLAQLHRFRFSHVVLCTGYHGEQVEADCGRNFRGMELSYSRETTPLGTAGALRAARSLCRGEQVLILNGDSFCQSDIAEFIRWHELKKATASMLLAEVEDTLRYGRVVTSDDGLVTDFTEKGQAGAGCINAGMYLISKQRLEEIPAAKNCSLEKEMFPRWTAERALFGYHAQVSSFIDIGTPDSLAKAQRLFSEQKDEI
jgi:NDP-sugar pyrophosphorylase family protein